jgi:glycosyltransferase involved in cell wall biosynthesis
MSLFITLNSTTPDTFFELVVPCYNPINGWETGMVKFIEACKESNSFRIVFVNDGSTVNEPQNVISAIKQKYSVDITVINLPVNTGKGAALRVGVEQCTSNKIIYTDADFPFENAAIIDMLKALDQGNDVVFGYRETSYYKKVPFFRKLVSKCFRIVIRAFVPRQDVDTQCGLKGFNQRGKKVFMAVKTKRYLFDFEFIRLSVRSKGLKIGSVKVKLKDNIVFSSLPFKVLLKESGNFFRIIFSSKRIDINE